MLKKDKGNHVIMDGREPTKERSTSNRNHGRIAPVAPKETKIHRRTSEFEPSQDGNDLQYHNNYRRRTSTDNKIKIKIKRRTKNKNKNKKN